MKDGDVRKALLSSLSSQHIGDPSTRIVEEMGVWAGTVRIDVAVINGEMSGYEIKSDHDNLNRLPTQSQLYSRVFDKLSLVASERHIEKARKIIPDWWGVTLASFSGDEIHLNTIKIPSKNPSPDPYLVAELLWKEEAIKILEENGLAKGWRSKRIKMLHERLANEVPFSLLANSVRATLKSRNGWLSRKNASYEFDMTVHS